MKISAGILVAGCCLALACRGNKDLTRKGQQYNVVQEGSANGVTSTINGPGANIPPVNSTPITGTGTNADTTTNFTLPTATEGSSGQPGNLAGTLPNDTSGRMGTMVPPSPQPAPGGTAVTPSPRPRTVQSPRTTTQPERTQPSRTAPPRETPRENPPSTTTQAPPTPAPTPTDTTRTTTTSTSTDTQPRHHDNPPPNTPPPDQQQPPPPPPPPTNTDTIGRP